MSISDKDVLLEFQLGSDIVVLCCGLPSHVLRTNNVQILEELSIYCEDNSHVKSCKGQFLLVCVLSFGLCLNEGRL